MAPNCPRECVRINIAGGETIIIAYADCKSCNIQQVPSSPQCAAQLSKVCVIMNDRHIKKGWAINAVKSDHSIPSRHNFPPFFSLLLYRRFQCNQINALDTSNPVVYST